MKANKTVTTTAMVTFALLLGLMAGKLAIKGRAQTAAQNAVITYTLQQREVITNDQGRVAFDWTRVLAQRGDGTTVRIDNIPGGHMKTVNYGAIDVTVTATDINSSIFTLGTGQPRIAPIGRGCLSVNSEAPVVGNETMLGYPVVHTRVPDDVMIDEQWIAKSLDCLELRRVYTYLDKGQPTGAQDALAATSVTLGEPDPALFALPANPVEVTPLTLANQVDPEAANSFLNLDKIYPAHKAMREALGLEPRRYAVPASPEVNKPRQ